jgi:tetratricopeptide (TPR) repeat protein
MAAAHLALARAHLALGEGAQAEGELERAVASGTPLAGVQHLRAHAIVLQGDGRAALQAAGQALPDHRVYALRMRGLAMLALGDLAAARAALEQAVAASPRDGDAWTDLGRFRFVAGDLVGAIAASDRAVTLRPQNVNALVLRGELVRQQSGLAASIDWFRRAVAIDGYHHDALIELAATLGDTGHSVEMLAMTRRAAEARPASPRVFYLQALLAARAGRYALARSVLAMPGGLLLAATLDMQAGANEQAASKLGQLINQQPMNLNVRRLFAASLLRVDAARNAIRVLRPLVLRADADSYALELAGRGLERIDERAEAGGYLDRAAWPVRAAPAPFSSDAGLAVLQAAADAAPGRPDVALPYIRALLEAGRPADALARAQRVAADNAGAPGAFLLVGDVMMTLNRPGDALAPYRRAAAIRFDQPVLLRLIEAAERTGDTAAASQVLAAFVAQNPRNLMALRLLADRQLAAGRYDDAVTTLEDIRFRIGNRDAALLAALAQGYAGLDDADAARRYGEGAYALAPANAVAVHAFGLSRLVAGDAAGAVPILEKAVALAPDQAVLRWRLAQAYAGAGRRTEAATLLRALIADPRFGDRAEAEALLARLA